MLAESERQELGNLRRIVDEEDAFGQKRTLRVENPVQRFQRAVRPGLEGSWVGLVAEAQVRIGRRRRRP
jgi:hypothetical protein